MLLDPLEEQFHLPATLVQFGNGECRQLCIVGQKHQFLVAFQIFITDASQRVRVFVATVGATQLDGLIADHAGGTIHLARIDSLILGIGFGSQYEETANLVHHVQAREVEIGPVHDIERTDFGEQLIQNVDIMQFAQGSTELLGTFKPLTPHKQQLYS